jgi:hypothetical protein
MELAKNPWLFAARIVQKARRPSLIIAAIADTSLMSRGKTILVIALSIRQQI